MLITRVRTPYRTEAVDSIVGRRSSRQSNLRERRFFEPVTSRLVVFTSLPGVQSAWPPSMSRNWFEAHIGGQERRAHSSEEEAARCACGDELGARDTSHASFEPEARVLREVRLCGRQCAWCACPGSMRRSWASCFNSAWPTSTRRARINGSFARLVNRRSTMSVFPSPATLLAPEAFREGGIDRERADRLLNIGRTAHHLPKLLDLSFEDARSKIRGLDPWSFEDLMGAPGQCRCTSDRRLLAAPYGGVWSRGRTPSRRRADDRADGAHSSASLPRSSGSRSRA